jgi:uncharacterized protein YcsI (UPF0317 family)
MARHYRRTVSGIPAGKPRYSANGGGDRVRGFLYAQSKALPADRDHASGDPEPARSAAGADLRTDLPGELIEKRGEIHDLWREDLVAFLLGCSLTFEHALIEAGVGVRNVERGTLVPMFISSLRCLPAGRFSGRQVVTMRPVPREQVELARTVTARYPHAHGAPLHIGNPEAIGISDLSRPDYGDPVEILPGEVPVFWACGVTPQVVALESRPEMMLTHEPGIMFLTDLPREGEKAS